jgi:hypothetical protein
MVLTSLKKTLPGPEEHVENLTISSSRRELRKSIRRGYKVVTPASAVPRLDS